MSIQTRPRSANVSRRNYSGVSVGGGWKSNRPKTASSLSASKQHRNIVTRTSNSTTPARTIRITTRVRRRNQRKKNNTKEGNSKKRRNKNKNRQGPETSKKTMQATFVCLQLDGPHSYNPRGNQRHKHSNHALGARSRGEKRVRESNDLVLRRGWRQPKQNPTYARAGPSRTTFGFHREFTPIQQQDQGQDDMYNIYRTNPQKKISIVNVNIIPVNLDTGFTKDDGGDVGDVGEGGHLFQGDNPNEATNNVESIVSPHTTRKNSPVAGTQDHQLAQEKQRSDLLRQTVSVMAVDLVSTLISGAVTTTSTLLQNGERQSC